ncbi:four helix bundle protein [Tenacibaculum lutimaris]|uniref:Four helix bundle protein n=1 Tax=Tenacibaculum lutimaris TaxID=285258 RepID=A0A420E414_9FLAO|nr:four helix bundle protein [Tenacibaculum lutimaris]RKF04633.1 four helix bundle protein [Tenacibaculum lutimaris]
MRNYRKFEVWKKSHELALKVYELTKGFPKEEIYGITSQLRRASLSVPTNIVEGVSRNTEKEFAHFVNIASGSSAEVEYLLEFASELNYLSYENFEGLNKEIISIRKMLNVLHSRLRK